MIEPRDDYRVTFYVRVSFFSFTTLWRGLSAIHHRTLSSVRFCVRDAS